MGVLRKHEDVSRAELDEDGKGKEIEGKEERFGSNLWTGYPAAISGNTGGLVLRRRART